MALVTDAVLRHFSSKFQKDPVALNCFYLRKTSVGPYIVEIQDVKTSSKGYCVVRASLLQAKVSDFPHLLGYGIGHSKDHDMCIGHAPVEACE